MRPVYNVGYGKKKALYPIGIPLLIARINIRLFEQKIHFTVTCAWVSFNPRGRLY